MADESLILSLKKAAPAKGGLFYAQDARIIAALSSKYSIAPK